MSGSFEKREKSFEAKWAHDEELRFKTYARRNKLLGLWAAAEMGIIGPAADAYAKEVVASDFERPAMKTSSKKSAAISTRAVSRFPIISSGARWKSCWKWRSVRSKPRSQNNTLARLLNPR